MKKTAYLTVIAALFFFAIGPAMAQGVDHTGHQGADINSFSSAQDHVWGLNRDQGLTYRMAGDREEGALRFYFRADKRDLEDPALADSLNRIAPATGIQFHMEF